MCVRGDYLVTYLKFPFFKKPHCNPIQTCLWVTAIDLNRIYLWEGMHRITILVIEMWCKLSIGLRRLVMGQDNISVHLEKCNRVKVVSLLKNVARIFVISSIAYKASRVKLFYSIILFFNFYICISFYRACRNSWVSIRFPSNWASVASLLTFTAWKKSIFHSDYQF